MQGKQKEIPSEEIKLNQSGVCVDCVFERRGHRIDPARTLVKGVPLVECTVKGLTMTSRVDLNDSTECEFYKEFKKNPVL
jgi:hypothetical protein